MIYIKTAEEIEGMRKACELVSLTLAEVAKWVTPGVTTRKLDNVAREFILDNGGKPACLGYQGFPGTLCIEVNETVVHGFPSGYALKEGDIVGTDCVVELNGFHGDSCYTFPIGEIDEKVRKLLVTTKESLYIGIETALAGKRIGDISNAIQTFCEKAGYSVVREMCGHGIGKSMHEEPEVPNFGRRGIGPVLKPGMCIAIEPMINMGSKNVVIERNGWECRTRDRRPSAHYEHTILITESEPEILTTFKYIEEVLGPERMI
ncbi:MAG: type I methionyl aminopeptidase [Muribaculaceae bacterium]|nr:type I methionyl aminopeptidase [Muribaculaceae bacterium]